MKTPRSPLFWPSLLALVLLKIALHLYTNTLWGFHRDEFLYLALGRHPDWGYWSNPPFIGWVSGLLQATLGDSLFVIRLFPMLVSAALIVLAVLMARELGAGRYGQFLAGAAMLLTPGNLRPGMLFQPVMPDIFFWALLAYLVIRFINTENRRYLLFFGFVFGLSFLNKYATAFALLGMAGAMLLSPYRRILWSREAALAALIAFLLILPNFLWQHHYGFPVVAHMQELSERQLANVRVTDFLSGQLFMHLPVTLVWVMGLVALFLPAHRRFRVLGWYILLVFALLLVLRGKPYYTLGLYPPLLAAGSVWWEKVLRRAWQRIALPVAILLLLLPTLPLGLPVLPLPQMMRYCNYLVEEVGFDGPMRWEDGRIHPLPQDYADMLGWKELGELAVRACQMAEGGDILVYGENYGQAGAVDYYGQGEGIPPAVSFSDSYRLWLPRSPSATTLVYINDELGEDVAELFEDIQLVGSVTNPHARERGTSVYLCRQPRQSLTEFWEAVVAEVMGR